MFGCFVGAHASRVWGTTHNEAETSGGGRFNRSLSFPGERFFFFFLAVKTSPGGPQVLNANTQKKKIRKEKGPNPRRNYLEGQVQLGGVLSHLEAEVWSERHGGESCSGEILHQTNQVHVLLVCIPSIWLTKDTG